MKDNLVRDFYYFLGLLIGASIGEWRPIVVVAVWIGVYRFWQWRKIEPEETKEMSDA